LLGIGILGVMFYFNKSKSCDEISSDEIPYRRKAEMSPDQDPLVGDSEV
jgi:hypothetical protein